jgi:hypothetical protein
LKRAMSGCHRRRFDDRLHAAVSIGQSLKASQHSPVILAASQQRERESFVGHDVRLPLDVRVGVADHRVAHDQLADPLVE